MSTSLYNREILNFPLGFPAKKSSPLKVKRSLFGPVDHEANKRFLETHFQNDLTHMCHKWNFDFREGKTLDPQGQFLWKEAETPVKLDKKRKHIIPDESSDCYFRPIQDDSRLFQPIEPAVQQENITSVSLRIPKQRTITDYYMLKGKGKRTISGKDKQPQQQQSEDRPKPKKIPKFGSS